MTTITAERLREVLHYDPETGVFTWKISPRANVKARVRAGSNRIDGYREIGIDGRYYYEHLLAWLYVHGEWPARHLDHRNRVRDDNKIKNLREATKHQNGGNRSISKSSRTGVVGVNHRDNRYVARIRVDYKLIHLGSFPDLESAAEARRVAEQQYFGEFARVA